jgi:hypothetical protein
MGIKKYLQKTIHVFQEQTAPRRLNELPRDQLFEKVEQY